MRKKTKIRPSPSSIKGFHYVAANNGRIPNECEFDFRFVTQEGHEEAMVFQVAGVKMALDSVSYLVDNGCNVIFDKDATSSLVTCISAKIIMEMGRIEDAAEIAETSVYHNYE